MKIYTAFGILFLTGCGVQSNYERPCTTIPENWRFETATTGEIANLAWWEQFQDPVLNDLIQSALDCNNDLAAASARVMEFYARYWMVFAKQLPELGLSWNMDRYKLPEIPNLLPFIPEIPRTNWLYDFFLTMSYEVDFWGKMKYASESQMAEYLAEVDGRKSVLLSLVSSLAKAYIQLRQYDNQLDIAKQTLETRKDAWEIANKRYDAGLVSYMEVKQAESEALRAETEVKNLEVFIAHQEDAISVLTGKPPGQIARGIHLTELQLPSIPTGLPSDLLQNRPDIMKAEQKLISAHAQIGVAKATFFPSIALTGVLGNVSTMLENFFSNPSSFFDFGLRTFQDLFKGGGNINNFKRSQAVALEAVHNYQQTILTALQEVENALISHKKTKEKLEIQKQTSAALEEYRRLSLLRYENGQNDYLTVLDAEKGLFQAQLDQTSVQAEVFLTFIDLYKALGQGWQIDCQNREL